jgi:hypothetical protein
VRANETKLPAESAMAGWLIDNRGTNYAFALGALATLFTFAITVIGRNKFSSEI